MSGGHKYVGGGGLLQGREKKTLIDGAQCVQPALRWRGRRWRAEPPGGEGCRGGSLEDQGGEAYDRVEDT